MSCFCLLLFQKNMSLAEIKKNVFMRRKITYGILFVCLVWSVGILRGEEIFRGDKKRKNNSSFYSRLFADSFSAVNISNSRVNSLEPQVVVNNKGIAYVIWVRMSSPKAIYFNTNESGSWGKSQNVSSGTNVSASGPWPHLTIDSSGQPHVVFTAKDSTGNYEAWFNSYYSQSESIGYWGSNVNVSQTYEGGSAYPTVAVDPNNLVRYVIWQDDEYKPDIWALMFRFRNPSNTNWSGRSTLPIPTSAYTPKIAADGLGRLHMIWLRRASGSSVIYYAQNQTPTNPQTWTDPIAISGQTNIDFAEIRLDADSQGNVYVAWEQNNGGNREIYFRRKIQDSWLNIENVSKTGANTQWPGLAVDKNYGNVYLVWQQRKDNKWQIFLKTLLEGSWMSAVDLTNNLRNSTMPSVAVDGMGEIHVVYSEEYSGIYDVMYTSTTKVGWGVLPPVGIKLTTKVDNSSGIKRNIIRWKKNPDNDDTRIKQYKIYRKEINQGINQYKNIASVSKSTFIYEDSNLPTNKKFSYALTALDVDNQESDYSDEVNEPLVFPPVGVEISSSLDSQKESKINLITWEENPENRYGKVENYKIYRRKSVPEGQFGLIAKVSGRTFRYVDKNLPFSAKFEYYLTSVDSAGMECEPSLVACEEPVFPPIGITVVTEVNESMFFKEKINVVRWKRNPLNLPVEVGLYKVYRKKIGDSGSEYAYIDSVDINHLRYFDRHLNLNEKYRYVLTAVTSEGHESRRSSAVDEN